MDAIQTFGTVWLAIGVFSAVMITTGMQLPSIHFSIIMVLIGAFAYLLGGLLTEW